MSEVGHPRELLAAYLDDELTIEQRSSVDRHLALCASCRTQLESLAALGRAVAEDPVPEIPADLAARIGRSIDEASVVPLPVRRWFLVPASIAATIAALGLLVVVQWRERAPATRPAAPAAEVPLSVEPSKEPPPAEHKQDLPVFDRLEKKAKEEPSSRSDVVQPSQEAGEREKLGALGEVGSAPAASPPATRPAVSGDFAPAPAPSPGAKAEQNVAGGVAAPEGYYGDSSARDAESALKSAAAPQGRFDQNVMTPDACGERWVDTGVLGVWFTEDRDRSVSDLATLARRLAGRLEPVEPDTDQVALVVPRKRLPEMIGALRGHGVAGLEGPFTPEDGFDCVRQRLHIESRSRP